MQRIIQRVAGLFSKFTAGGASLSMAVLFLIVFINSVRRYTIGKSLEWGEELPIFIAIYGVMFGTAWAYMQGRHIRLIMLEKFLSESLTRRLTAIVDLVVAVCGILLIYSSWMFVVQRGRLEASGIINLAKGLKTMTGWGGLIWIGHLYPYQAAMVLGGVLLTTAALLKILLRFTENSSFESVAG